MTPAARRVIILPHVLCTHCARQGLLVYWRGRVLCRACQMTLEQAQQLIADVIQDKQENNP